MNPAPAVPSPPRHRSHKGLALIELMIAMALGLVIVAALGQLYSGSKTAARLGDSLTRLNENGRFAVDLISNDLRMAGYLSCGGSAARIGNSVNSGTHWLYQTDAILGFDGGDDNLPSEFANQVRAGTDVLILRRAAIDLERTLIADDVDRGVMQVGDNHGFQPGEILVISDTSCTQASMFQVTQVLDYEGGGAGAAVDAIEHASADDVIPGNCTDNLFGSFDCDDANNAEPNEFNAGSVVSRFLVNAYYISNTEPPALMRKRLSHASGEASVVTEELIRDVENLQIFYGRDTFSDAGHTVDDYVPADEVTEWDKVLSLRLALLMRSPEARVRTESLIETIDLVGHSITTPKDRYLRRVFSNVVALRNNLP